MSSSSEKLLGLLRCASSIPVSPWSDATSPTRDPGEEFSPMAFKIDSEMEPGRRGRGGDATRNGLRSPSSSVPAAVGTEGRGGSGGGGGMMAGLDDSL